MGFVCVTVFCFLFCLFVCFVLMMKENKPYRIHSGNIQEDKKDVSIRTEA